MSNGTDNITWRERFFEWLTAGVVIAGVATSAVIADEPFEWGLHIVFFDVNQADAIAIVAPNGDAAVIDAGHGSTAAAQIAAFLQDGGANGVGEITDVKLGFVTHYDLDHMGGFARLPDRGITFRSVYDQGTSVRRDGAARYDDYLEFVDDPNDNMIQDTDEDAFIRKRARVGLHWKLGDARIRVLSARGDTRGRTHDLDLDPSDQNVDENPGSIALLISLGDFELYTAGDQTSDDWKSEPDTEIAVVNAGVLGEDNDIDVYKVNHHGSDTSTGQDFILALDPEVAVVSSRLGGDGLPKLVAIQQLVTNGAVVYITGDGLDASGAFTQSSVSEDDGFVPPNGSFVNDAGDVHILVSTDGLRYRVFAGGEWREFSAVDSDNVH